MVFKRLCTSCYDDSLICDLSFSSGIQACFEMHAQYLAIRGVLNPAVCQTDMLKKSLVNRPCQTHVPAAACCISLISGDMSLIHNS